MVLEVLVVLVVQMVQEDLEVHGRRHIRCFQSVQLDLVDRRVPANLQNLYSLAVLAVQCRLEVPVVRSCPEILADLVVRSDLLVQMLPEVLAIQRVLEILEVLYFQFHP